MRHFISSLCSYLSGASGNLLKPQTPMGTSSRLSKTLQEVLHDKDALAYFIQYMAARDAEHIIKFWLDAGSFQASSWTRIRTHSLNKANGGSKANSPEQLARQGTGSSTASSSTSVSSSSPGHHHAKGQGEGDEARRHEGQPSPNETSSIRRTGTAEANLNLMSGGGTCDATRSDCVHGPCAKTTAEPEARFAEAGAHGTDPLSRGSLRALREDGASSSRDSGLGSSSPYLEAGTSSSLPNAATTKDTTDSAQTKASPADGGAAGCVPGPTNTSPTTSASPEAGQVSTTPAANASHLDTTQETSFQEKLRKSELSKL